MRFSHIARLVRLDRGLHSEHILSIWDRKSMADNMFSIEQKKICNRYQVEFSPPVEDSILGVSLNVRSPLVPVNGLRHPPHLQTNGWYIWAGETFPADEDGFKPLHYSHILEWNHSIVKYLALPPGWRFLTDGSYEDVWFDGSLLNIDTYTNN